MTAQASNLTANILLVEDDDDLAELIQMQLLFQGHQVVRATHISEAENQFNQQRFDIVVLDRGLPDGDGLSFCQQLRQRQQWQPVLMLTARDCEMDKVAGLEAGVDDYMTKPFSVLEFQARVRNVLRRFAQLSCENRKDEQQSRMVFGPLEIMPELHQVSLQNRQVTLTATEFTLLRFLASRPGRVYSKDELLDHVWQTNHSGYHHTVCSTINRLRGKLCLEQSEHHFIQTVWGVGYKFQPLPH